MEFYNREAEISREAQFRGKELTQRLHEAVLDFIVRIIKIIGFKNLVISFYGQIASLIVGSRQSLSVYHIPGNVVYIEISSPVAHGSDKVGKTRICSIIKSSRLLPNRILYRRNEVREI